MFYSRSNYFISNNKNTTCVILPMDCWCTSMEGQVSHVATTCISFIDILVHASNLYTSGVRGYIWFYLYFPPDYNSKKSTNNAKNWLTSVNNYGMIRVLVVFKKIIGCGVFNLPPTPCKSDEILAIIIIRKKIGLWGILDRYFMSRYHSLVSQLAGCVSNVNSYHNINVLYLSKIM